MKKLKKLLSIVLAVAMVLSLVVVTSADDDTSEETTTNTSTGTYTITISNAEVGETYSAYKIFDVTYDADKNNYSYTIDSVNNPFYSAISQACDNSGDTLYGYLTLTPSASDSSVYVVEYKGSTNTEDDFMEKLSAVIKSVIDDSSVTPTPAQTTTASGTTCTLDVTDSGAGYYYVNTTVSSVVALDTTDPTVTISNKWSEPTVDKGVYNDAPADNPNADEDSSGSYDTTGGTEGGTTGDSDAAIGETVYYQTTISNIYGVSKLVLHDTMTTGLTFNDDVTMYVYTAYSNLNSFTAGTTYYTYNNGVFTKVTNTENGPTDGTTYYTETTATDGYSVLKSTDIENRPEDSCTFEIKIEDIDSLKDSSSGAISVTDGSYLVVEYTATVNSNAVIYDSTTTKSNDNKTYVSYGDASTSESDKTKTYVYPVYIYKYCEDNSSTATALSGAVFTIKNAEGKYAVFTYDSTSGVYTLGAEINGTMTYWVSELGTNDTENGVYYTLTTNETGILKIAGLDADTTYTIHEETAPSGYNALSTDLNFYIVGSDSDDEKTQGDVYYWEVSATSSKDNAKKNDSISITDITDSKAVPIENKSGSELPSTGGIGVTIFYVVGGILILAAAGVIVISRKKIKK